MKLFYTSVRLGGGVFIEVYLLLHYSIILTTLNYIEDICSVQWKIEFYFTSGQKKYLFYAFNCFINVIL